MKFYINRELLLIPLQQIVSVIEKRQTMPVLANVLINLDNTNLVLTGTDLEIQIIVKLTVLQADNFSITVPARKFLDIIRLLPVNSEIKFELVNEKVKITSNRSRFSLSTLPAENYPEFVETSFNTIFFINANQLKKALDKTLFCMANQDVRYYLNGLMLNISNNTIKFIASDGHRLSIYEDKLEKETGYEARIILPRKGVLELNRLLVESDIELKIEFSNNNIRICVSNMVFSAKLVDSRYPDFSRVFQQEFFTQLTVERQILKDALTRVSILANEKIKGVTLELSSDSILISTHNPEHEEAEEQLPIQYSGEFLSIAFNGQYLLDAVSNLNSDSAVLSFGIKPGCCIVQEPDNDLYKFVVMSMLL